MYSDEIIFNVVNGAVMSNAAASLPNGLLTIVPNAEGYPGDYP
jgi:hypothetical protein